jgi:DNA-directed RNA polymerase specialized sigma24 family protein
LAQKPRFSDEELDGLLRKLTAYAVVLFAQSGLSGSEVSLRGSGLSPEDLAVATLGKLVSGELNYHRSKGRLDSYLATTMRHDFLDLLRSKAHSTSVDLESSHKDTVPEHTQDVRLDCSPRQHDPVAIVAEQECRQKVFALVKGDRDLEEMAYAIVELNATNPRDIAELLKTHTTDIQNRKKRMRRRLAEFLGRQAD